MPCRSDCNQGREPCKTPALCDDDTALMASDVATAIFMVAVAAVVIVHLVAVLV